MILEGLALFGLMSINDTNNELEEVNKTAKSIDSSLNKANRSLSNIAKNTEKMPWEMTIDECKLYWYVDYKFYENIEKLTPYAPNIKTFRQRYTERRKKYKKNLFGKVVWEGEYEYIDKHTYYVDGIPASSAKYADELTKYAIYLDTYNNTYKSDYTTNRNNLINAVENKYGKRDAVLCGPWDTQFKVKMKTSAND